MLGTPPPFKKTSKKLRIFKFIYAPNKRPKKIEIEGKSTKTGKVLKS